MSALNSLPQIESALRELIAGEAFEQAGPLLDDFATAVQAEARRFAGDPARLLSLRAQVVELLAWAEARTRAYRSCAGSDRARLGSLRRYKAQYPILRRSITA